MKYISALLLFSISLSACSTGPNHFGNPLTLPGRAITNGISELGYKARRARVKDFTKRNTAQIHRDILAGGGRDLSTAMDLACVEPVMRGTLINELSSRPDLYMQPDPEPLVVALMVHGDP